jgi:hypothetical protein
MRTLIDCWAIEVRTSKLEEDFLLLRDHCIVLRRDYNTYTSLFNEENRDLLSHIAATFFTDLAEIMHRDWVLQACKIMDPASTKRNNEIFKNITLKLINEQLKSEGLYNQKIENASARIKSYGDKIISARNKRLAHYDRDHQINNTILGETTAAELHQFLSDIQEYCNEVGIMIGLCPLDFNCSGCRGDVFDFLKFLRCEEQNT